MQGGSLWEGEAPAEPNLRTDGESVGLEEVTPFHKFTNTGIASGTHANSLRFALLTQIDEQSGPPSSF